MSYALRYLESRGTHGPARADFSAETIVHGARPQRLYLRFDTREHVPENRDFQRIVTREPEYQSDEPVRGVASLGSQQYAFVIDVPAARSMKPGKKSRYCPRLFFDLNHNGDLTDDEPIDAEAGKAAGTLSGTGYCQFPVVRLTVDADGTEVPYAFIMSANWQTAGNYKYLTASLWPAVYREGEITLDGRRRKIALVDFDTNGRFDDEIKALEPAGMRGTAAASGGDLVVFGPDPGATEHALIGFRAGRSSQPALRLETYPA